MQSLHVTGSAVGLFARQDGVASYLHVCGLRPPSRFPLEQGVSERLKVALNWMW